MMEPQLMCRLFSVVLLSIPFALPALAHRDVILPEDPVCAESFQKAHPNLVEPDDEPIEESVGAYAPPIRTQAVQGRGVKAFNVVPMLATLAFFVGASPSPANATAEGFESWNPTTIKGLPVPSGTLYHRIEGDGLMVNTNMATALSASPLCDASVRFTYGNGATHSDGAIHSGCTGEAKWVYHPNKKMPVGSSCAELWVERWRRMI